MTSYRPSVAAVVPLPAGPASGYETDLDLKGQKVVAVLSGGNSDAELLFRLVKAQMGVETRTRVPDTQTMPSAEDPFR